MISPEIKLGAQCDCTRLVVLKLLVGWISSHCISAVWLGTPCNSWTQARRGPPGSSWCRIRSRSHILGLPNLRPQDVHKIQHGNATAAASARIIKACINHHVPCVPENPGSSPIFHSPYIAPLIAHSESTSVTLDCCQLQARWRKRTRLVAWNMPHVTELEKRCQGRQGLCSRTSQRHITLEGVDPVSKQLWTKIAEPYPTSFCRKAASISDKTIEIIRNNNLTRLLNNCL